MESSQWEMPDILSHNAMHSESDFEMREMHFNLNFSVLVFKEAEVTQK